MQTFLPLPSFEASMRCLDDKRLGKQRVEAFQILIALEDPWAISEQKWRHEVGLSKAEPKLPSRWRNHPACLMWKGYSQALQLYYNCALKEWARRGYLNTMRPAPITDCVELPPWFGDPAFHDSHKSNLLRKSPVFYSQHEWAVGSEMPYVWPKNESYGYI